MKKLLSMLLALGTMFSFVACGGEDAKANDADAKDGFKISVIQLVKHDALDKAYEGFVEGLAELGYKEGENLTIDYQNCGGEQANCITISDKIINNGSDLILAIATPAAQAIASKTSDIPILATAVTDFESAKLTSSNISGTSDMAPVERQIELLHKLSPEAKTVGMLYCSSEANSKFQVTIAEEACQKLGLETKSYTVSNTSEVKQIAESMVGKVDAIYVPCDNVIASSMPTVSSVVTPASIPVIVAEEGPCVGGGLATYGLNYFNLGKQTAVMADKILKGEAKPEDLPVETLEKTDLFINEDIMNALEISVPEELLSEATMVSSAK